MITRNNLFALLTSAALLCAGAASADTPIVSLENGVEATSSIVLMPSSSLGSVMLTCDKCTSRSYQLTSSTRYFIGKSTVSFSDFAAGLHATRKVQSVVVFIKPDNTVTRVTMTND